MTRYKLTLPNRASATGVVTLGGQIMDGIPGLNLLRKEAEKEDSTAVAVVEPEPPNGLRVTLGMAGVKVEIVGDDDPTHPGAVIRDRAAHGTEAP